MQITNQTVKQLAKVLADKRLRLVLAESCTGGMTAALLTQIPGISNWFCGSAVTYRPLTKTHWLRLSPELINRFTAESLEVTDAMALEVLTQTPEADLSAAITGHLGPGALFECDGQVFISLAARTENSPSGTEEPIILFHHTLRLNSTHRIDRQIEAATLMLGQICQAASGLGDFNPSS